MTRQSNLNMHNQYKTWADRQAAGDDALAQIPSAVAALTATANGANAMDLAWTDSNVAGTLVRIERSPTDNTSFAEIDIVLASALAYADSGLTTATPYFYRVTAFTETSQTAASPEANDTTA